jgi:hypothetical protein
VFLQRTRRLYNEEKVLLVHLIGMQIFHCFMPSFLDSLYSLSSGVNIKIDFNCLCFFRMAPEVAITETCKDDPYDYKVM